MIQAQTFIKLDNNRAYFVQSLHKIEGKNYAWLIDFITRESKIAQVLDDATIDTVESSALEGILLGKIKEQIFNGKGAK